MTLLLPGAEEFADQFKDLRADLDQVRDSAVPPEFVYHFTTLEAFRNIVESNTLRASGAYYSNDLSEIEHGCTLLSRVIDESRTKIPESTPQSIAVLSAIKQYFEMNQIARRVFLYIASFCGEADRTEHWRAYAKRGGCAIGFRTAIRSNLGLHVEGGFFTARLRDVVYDDSIKEARIIYVIRRLAEWLQKTTFDLKAAFDPKTSEAQRLSAVMLMASDLLLDEIVCFKDRTFRNEKEWRLVVTPKSFLDLDSDMERDPVKALFHFRTEESLGVVPYVRLVPIPISDNPKLPIGHVVYDNSLPEPLNDNSIELFLRVRGFETVSVERSKNLVRL